MRLRGRCWPVLATLVVSLLAAGSLPPALSQGGECDVPFGEKLADQGLNIAMQAIDLAGFGPKFDDDSTELTVFAPTDAAFVAALEQFGLEISDVLNDPIVINELFSYHVVEDKKLLAEQLEDGMELETAVAGMSSCGVDTVTVSRDEDGVSIIGGLSSARITTANIEICKSVLHIVDEVLVNCRNIGGVAGEVPAELTSQETASAEAADSG